MVGSLTLLTAPLHHSGVFTTFRFVKRYRALVISLGPHDKNLEWRGRLWRCSISKNHHLNRVELRKEVVPEAAALVKRAGGLDLSVTQGRQLQLDPEKSDEVRENMHKF